MDTVKQVIDSQLESTFKQYEHASNQDKATAYHAMSEHFKAELAGNLKRVNELTQSLEYHLQIDAGLKMAIDALTEKYMDCLGIKEDE